MTTDSFFATMLVSMIALFFGFVLAFGGYRFFLVLLPIFGFFFGFSFGAQAIQAIFGGGFLSSVTSWVVGFFFGAAFAVMSYLFYFFAVTVIAGALGYSLGVGIMQAIGFDFGLIEWLVGVVVAIVVAFGVLILNIQKWVVMIATALLGAGTIVGTFLFLFGGLPSDQLVQNPVRVALQNSPLWMIVFVIVAAVGVVVQYETTRHWEVTSYNRIAGMADAEVGPVVPETGELGVTS
jgi:hypothetical protein